MTLILSVSLIVKTRIRGSNVVVVVLTPNKDSVNHLLTLNNFEGIQPLIDVPSLREIRIAEGRTIPSTFQLDWAKLASMEWDTKEMKIAILTDYRFSGSKPDKDEEALRAKIDTSLNHMPRLERKTATPALLMNCLTATGALQLEKTTLTQTNASARMNQETCLGCSACHVM
jgi:hypothetical protein